VKGRFGFQYVQNRGPRREQGDRSSTRERSSEPD
jgi:hypothetical protein